MIMPTKYLKENETLLGLGAILLEELSSEKSLSDLWENAKKYPDIGNFERFILTLDFLFIIGLVTLKNNNLMRMN